MKCRVEINICHHFFKKNTTDEDDQEDHDDGGGGGDKQGDDDDDIKTVSSTPKSKGVRETDKMMIRIMQIVMTMTMTLIMVMLIAIKVMAWQQAHNQQADERPMQIQTKSPKLDFVAKLAFLHGSC